MRSIYCCMIMLLVVLQCRSMVTQGIRLKASRGNITIIEVSGTIVPPLECYRTVLQNTTKLKVDYYDGMYSIKVNKSGTYWCEDSRHIPSNRLSIFLEAGIKIAEYVPPERIIPKCPAQTTKDENGLVLEWPSISVGETYFINGTNCIRAVAKCVIMYNSEPQLIEESNWNANWPTPCYIQELNLTEATMQLEKFARKSMLTRKDLNMATAIINQALQTNHTVLAQSRENTTFIVQTLDSILGRVVLSPGERVNVTHPQVSVFLMNTEKELPRGIALTNVSRNLNGSSVITFDMESDIDSRENEIDMAIVLSSVTKKSNSNLKLAFFNDDGAFIQKGKKVNSRIVSVNMDSANTVDIMFKSWNSSGEKKCVFWDFNYDGGGWNASGCELVPSPGKNYDICRCTHLTHFAEIISPPGKIDSDIVLDIVSMVGCSLSLIGLLGIFLTGIIFQKWRAQIGNKILLNLSTAIALNMVIFLIIASGQLPNMCIPLGALLHYSILTSFCWMLVCAGLQFMRLVSVFKSQHITHLLLKASLFAWGVPLIPVVVLLAINVELYEDNGRGLCYPGGLAFYLGVLCPVLMIIFVNLIVFGTIIHHLIESRSIQHHVQSERKMAWRSFTTTILLFFLLGLSWIFGLLANLSKVFAYLFCITATLQGFVLFLFFVLAENKSRRYWTQRSSTQKATSTSATPVEGVALRRHEET